MMSFFNVSQVLYNASNFLEKNRDRLGNNLLDILQKSENDFIKDLFMAELTDTGVLSRFDVVSLVATAVAAAAFAAASTAAGVVKPLFYYDVLPQTVI